MIKITNRVKNYCVFAFAIVATSPVAFAAATKNLVQVCNPGDTKKFTQEVKQNGYEVQQINKTFFVKSTSPKTTIEINNTQYSLSKGQIINLDLEAKTCLTIKSL